MNARASDVATVGITGGHGVSGVTENVENLVQLCCDKGMVIGDTRSEKKCVHKYMVVSGLGVNGS